MARVPVLKRLKDLCRTTRAAILEARVASTEEIANYWPGGAENRDKDLWGWIYCSMNLARFMERAQQDHAEVTPRQTAKLLSAMQGAPHVVVLSRPVRIDEEEVHEFRIAPKSWGALWRLAVLSRIAQQLVRHTMQIESSGGDPDLQLDAHNWILRISLQLIWGACCGDGAGRDFALPWNARKVSWPELPAWLDDLAFADRLAIEAEFFSVHGGALPALQPYLAPSDDEDPLSGWHTMFSAYATEHGDDAQSLMEDRAFQPFLIQLTLASHSARKAREKSSPDRDEPAAPVATGMVA